MTSSIIIEIYSIIARLYAGHEKEVEKVLRGGVNNAVLKICAKVCRGERLYSEEAVKKFEQIKARLERQETEEFRAIGVQYQWLSLSTTDSASLVMDYMSPDRSAASPTH